MQSCASRKSDPDTAYRSEQQSTKPYHVYGARADVMRSLKSSWVQMADLRCPFLVSRKIINSPEDKIKTILLSW